MQRDRGWQSYTPVERFWMQIKKTEGCWEWIGSCQGREGDRRGALKINRKTVKAARFSWEIHVGPIPEGLHVLHVCDNTKCVRPDHLFLGTHSDNMRDAYRKKRKSNVGEKNPKCKLTEDQVRDIRRRFLEVGGPVLAKEYGLERTVPWQIFKRRRWKHVD